MVKNVRIECLNLNIFTISLRRCEYLAPTRGSRSLDMSKI